MKRDWGWLGLAMAAALLPLGCGGAQGPDARRGEDLFNQRCWNCHEKDTQELPATPGRGPGLKGFRTRTPHADMSGAPHEHNDELVRNLIRNGSTNMPPQGAGLSDADMADVIAYVNTL
jgi:mono/diheme cytochrome c family protein